MSSAALHTTLDSDQEPESSMRFAHPEGPDAGRVEVILYVFMV